MQRRGRLGRWGWRGRRKRSLPSWSRWRFRLHRQLARWLLWPACSLCRFPSWRWGWRGSPLRPFSAGHGLSERRCAHHYLRRRRGARGQRRRLLHWRTRSGSGGNRCTWALAFAGAPHSADLTCRHGRPLVARSGVHHGARLGRSRPLLRRWPAGTCWWALREELKCWWRFEGLLRTGRMLWCC